LGFISAFFGKMRKARVKGYWREGRRGRGRLCKESSLI
jgi:hypothetical protein